MLIERSINTLGMSMLHIHFVSAPRARSPDDHPPRSNADALSAPKLAALLC
jgi:hypothetical protein